ncbi:MAG TPA: hypothetical protein VIH90_02795 [Candidatus Saccharimonadales bacterium]
MILDTTSKSIELFLGGAVTSNQLQCVASWADITTSTFTPGSTDTQSNNTTSVTIVAAPASSTQRQVKAINVYNADTAAATLTIRLNNSSTYRVLLKVALQPGYTLQFTENSWVVTDGSGNVLQSSQVSAGGASNQIQYNSGNALAGDPNLTWTSASQTLTIDGANSTLSLLSGTDTPASPAAGYINIFSRTVANRTLLAEVGPSGLSTSLQPFLARNKVGYWDPPGNATTVPGVFGITAPTVVGTATARNVATTNIATRMRRLGYVSSTTAGSLTEARIAVAQFSCGSGANDGSGFFYVSRWIPSDAATVSGERNFCGLMNSTAAATNVEPNTLTNCIGVAQLSTDATQLYIVYAGSAAQTAIPLGTNFPGATLSSTPYELAIFAPNSVANTYYYQVTNIATGNIATGTLSGTSTQVPQSSTLLAHKIWATNNATGLAVAFDVCSIYFETDN